MRFESVTMQQNPTAAEAPTLNRILLGWLTAFPDHVAGLRGEKAGREKWGKEGSKAAGMDWKGRGTFPLMCSWNRATDWLRSALILINKLQITKLLRQMRRRQCTVVVQNGVRSQVTVMLPGVKLIIDIGMRIGYRTSSKRLHPTRRHWRQAARRRAALFLIHRDSRYRLSDEAE